MPLGNFHLKCYQTFCTNRCNVFYATYSKDSPICQWKHTFKIKIKVSILWKSWKFLKKLRLHITVCWEVIFNLDATTHIVQFFERVLYNISKGEVHALIVTHFLIKNKSKDFFNFLLLKKLEILRFHITVWCDVIFVWSATKCLSRIFVTFLYNISKGQLRMLMGRHFLRKIMLSLPLCLVFVGVWLCSVCVCVCVYLCVCVSVFCVLVFCEVVCMSVSLCLHERVFVGVWFVVV